MSKTLEGKIELETGWIFSNMKTGIYQCTVEKGKQYEGITWKDNLYDCKIRYDCKTYNALAATYGRGFEFQITKGPAWSDVNKILCQIVKDNEGK